MFLEKIQQANTFIFDVDGVLTDGNVHVTEKGDFLRQFNIKDGYALQLAVKRGFQIAIISGAHSLGVELRLKGLGIKNIFLGVDSKLEIFNKLQKEHSLSAERILYMGDDIPDLAVMKLVGIPVCPADAVEEIKAISCYISPRNGGKACVREVIEKVLKAQNQWYDVEPSAKDSLLPKLN